MSGTFGQSSYTDNPVAETMRVEMTPARRDDGAVSLHPLSPEDALRALLRTAPPKRED